MKTLPRHNYRKAWEWREKLLSKKTTAVSLVEEYLDRAKKDSTNSFITLCEEQALEQAKLQDKNVREKDRFGLLFLLVLKMLWSQKVYEQQRVLKF